MSHNTWLHKVAGVIAKPLVETPVTPNHITTVRLAIGVTAAACMATGTQDWMNIGAALFVLSMVLDRADGVLARISGKMSRVGHLYDLWSDAICNALIFVGLGYGLREGTSGADAITYGVIAGCSVACVLFLVLKLENLSGERAGEIGSFLGFDPDDAMLLVPIAIWLGWAEQVLTAASIGAPIFAALFFIIFLYRRRKFEAKS
jgi:archaetidylinositol phosphate synthase